MFNPTIGRNTMTSEIIDQTADALRNGETVRLGRWTARRVGFTGRVDLTRHSEESRSGPLTGGVPMGSACPETQAAHSLVEAWKGDW
jgi:hypothetical protein